MGIPDRGILTEPLFCAHPPVLILKASRTGLEMSTGAGKKHLTMCARMGRVVLPVRKESTREEGSYFSHRLCLLQLSHHRHHQPHLADALTDTCSTPRGLCTEGSKTAWDSPGSQGTAASGSDFTKASSLTATIQELIDPGWQDAGTSPI